MTIIYSVNGMSSAAEPGSSGATDNLSTFNLLITSRTMLDVALELLAYGNNGIPCERVGANQKPDF